MPEHPFLPSNYTSSSGDTLNSCLKCGKTREAHDLRLSWNGREFRFPSMEAANRAGFYVESARG